MIIIHLIRNTFKLSFSSCSRCCCCEYALMSLMQYFNFFVCFNLDKFPLNEEAEGQMKKQKDEWPGGRTLGEEEKTIYTQSTMLSDFTTKTMFKSTGHPTSSQPKLNRNSETHRSAERGREGQEFI